MRNASISYVVRAVSALVGLLLVITAMSACGLGSPPGPTPTPTALPISSDTEKYLEQIRSIHEAFIDGCDPSAMLTALQKLGVPQDPKAFDLALLHSQLTSGLAAAIHARRFGSAMEMAQAEYDWTKLWGVTQLQWSEYLTTHGREPLEVGFCN